MNTLSGQNVNVMSSYHDFRCGKYGISDTTQVFCFLLVYEFSHCIIVNKHLLFFAFRLWFHVLALASDRSQTPTFNVILRHIPS